MSLIYNQDQLKNLEKLEILKLFKWISFRQVFLKALGMNDIIRAVDIIDKLEENDSNHNNKPIDVKHLSLNSYEKIFK
jgi:hypothetical protein